MKRHLLASLVSITFLAVTVVFAGGCKQGVGEVCQINDDCKDGLVCVASSGVCQDPSADSWDAAVPDGAVTADATDFDATSFDAAGDGDGDGDGDSD